MDDAPKEPKKPNKKKKFGWNSPDHNPEEFRLSLVEHLEELRTRIFRCIYILVVFWAIAWYKFESINDFLILSDGTFELPLLGKVQAAGLTVSGLRQALETRYAARDYDVTVAVIFMKAPPLAVPRIRFPK